MKALLVVGLVACSPTSDSKPRRPDPPREAATEAGTPVVADARTTQNVIDATGSGSGGTVMTPKTCDEAKHAIAARHFVGWAGLPADCSPDVMFGVKFDEKEWPARM